MSMSYKLTVLGSQGAYPTLHNPCSGFVLSSDSFHVVLDLGYNTLQPLLSRFSPDEIDAVVLTHEHPDHWLDFHALMRILFYGPQKFKNKKKLAVYCTQGTIDQIAHLESNVPLEQVLDIHILTDECRFVVGPFVLSGVRLPHFVHNIGIRLSVQSSDPDADPAPLIAYTGDTGPSPLLADLGRDTQLFIVEATDRDGEADGKADDRNLMTSGEAGFWAEKAATKKLLLTHFWPGNDREKAVDNAQKHFRNREVLAASPGLEIKFSLGA